MRIGAFLFGSLIGAAAAVLLTRKRPPVWLIAVWSGAGRTVSGLLEKTGETASERNAFGRRDEAAPKRDPTRTAAGNATNQTGPERTGGATETGGNDLPSVAEVVNRDPALKREVEDIMREQANER